MAPLVTIGVPAYNGGRHLVEALESARAQAYHPLEIIVSDDASTDDTEAICRRFAAIDPRVRYLRQDRNRGAVDNFRAVLDLARGEYFTWLAQDDVVSDTRYVRTTVEFLERNPDVVCCMCSLYMLDHEIPGSRTLLKFDMISADRPWADARLEQFRWPHGDAILAIYGMFRRVELARVPPVSRSYRGRPTSAWWETPVLTMLAGRGRIVAIPDALRSKRSTPGSDGWRTYQMAPPFDLFVLGMRTKLLSLRSAWQARVPTDERVALLRVTLGNLFRGNLRRPHDVPSLIRERRRELTVLERAAAERSALIASLHREIALRLEIVGRPGGDANHRDGTNGAIWGTSLGPVRGELPRGAASLERALERFDRSRGSLASFFRPPPAWMLALCEDLNEAVGLARQHCEVQLETVNLLHTEAASILGGIAEERPTRGRPGAPDGSLRTGRRGARTDVIGTHRGSE